MICKALVFAIVNIYSSLLYFLDSSTCRLYKVLSLSTNFERAEGSKPIKFNEDFQLKQGQTYFLILSLSSYFSFVVYVYIFTVYFPLN